MINDLRHLRPSELAQLLNSTSQGPSLTERRLRGQRSRAGLRIGDGRTVDLYRYLAWVADRLQEPTATANPEADYAAHRAASADRKRRMSMAGRDIGSLPPVAHPDRRAAAQRDFAAFCRSYFPATFTLPFCPDHLKVIAKIEQAVLQGGLFAMAMPRGSGKSTVVERACLWALLYGHRQFVALIGSDEGHASDMLDTLKGELEENELLAEDFPEVCQPIRSLDGIVHRAAGQLLEGKRTRISWTAKQIILANIPGSQAAGAVVRVAGITARIRGMKFKRPDGKTVRPSLVIIDDPQTDESARSLSQVQQRESILVGAILGLAGPGQKIAGIMPCTVIYPGDLADRILDRDKHPEWNGERTRMVYKFPTNEALWKQYADIRARCLRETGKFEEATAFYVAHRQEMDAGAEVAWPERFDPDEVSALQNAMNRKLNSEAAFFAECQNNPLPATVVQSDDLTVDDIVAKVNGLDPRIIPRKATHLTAFVDVHQKLLFYIVTAWADDFTGWVVDYGTYPDQLRPYFTLREVTSTLSTAAPSTGLEGAIHAGLEHLTSALLDREWERDDGMRIKIERCMVDANWGQSTEVVYQFCRSSSHAAILLPSHGRYVGAASLPFFAYHKQPGDRIGLNWRIPATVGRTIRHAVFDTNYWKTFLRSRLAIARGDRGGLSFYGKDPERHRLLAEHLCAEYRVRTQGRGREVDEWKVRPDGGDNHWLDCLVGTAVAGSIQGLELPTDAPNRPQKKEPIRLSELPRKFYVPPPRKPNAICLSELAQQRQGVRP